MKFKTFFKKINHKKHGKKQKSTSPISPSSLHSSPISSSYSPTQPINYPIRQEQDSVIFSYNINNNNLNINTSISSLSSSLPTSFPPTSYSKQPLKQKDSIEQLYNIYEESFDSSKNSSVSSQSDKDDNVFQSRITNNNENKNGNKNENKNENEINIKNSSNDVTSSEMLNCHAMTLTNANDDNVISYPYECKNLTQYENSNTLCNPSSKDYENDLPLKSNNNNTNEPINKLNLNHLEKEMNNVQIHENGNISPTDIHLVQEHSSINITKEELKNYTLNNYSKQTQNKLQVTSPLTSPLSTPLSTPLSSPLSSPFSPR
eukprot:jgi/Orpsp1_1/1174298/evm.model.c7180000049586.1